MEMQTQERAQREAVMRHVLLEELAAAGFEILVDRNTKRFLRSLIAAHPEQKVLLFVDFYIERCVLYGALDQRGVSHAEFLALMGILQGAAVLRGSYAGNRPTEFVLRANISTWTTLLPLLDALSGRMPPANWGKTTGFIDLLTHEEWRYQRPGGPIDAQARWTKFIANAPEWVQTFIRDNPFPEPFSPTKEDQGAHLETHIKRDTHQKRGVWYFWRHLRPRRS
jgi:hypothetical protein